MQLKDRLKATLAGTCLTILSVLLPSGALRAQEDFVPPGMLQGIAQSAAEQIGLLIDADETSFANEVATAKGNVHIRYEGTEIYAGKAEYHRESGDIYTEDGVAIYRDGSVYKGEAAIYNINTNKITANHLKSGTSPMFWESSSVDTNMAEMDEVRMVDGEFTTHDSVDPNYRIKAKSIEIRNPSDPQRGKVIFKNATIYAGKTPVLWLPYLAQTLDQDLGYHFIPGYRSNWGGYLLNRYGALIGDHTLATYRLDFRSTRGVAAGIDFKSIRHSENPNVGNFKFYLTEDSDPQKTRNGRERTDPVDSTRYRVNLQHRIFLPGPDESTLYVDIDFNKISDAFFYEDFFEEEYRIDPEPDNIININKVFPIGTLSLLARANVNDFYRSDTRLPEIALDLNTHPIFNTGLFHTSQNSFGIYKEKLGGIERARLERQAESLESKLMDPTATLLNDPAFDLAESQTAYDELLALLDADRGFSRYDSFHEVSMPKTLFGWLNVNPKVGFRATSYSNIESPRDEDIDDQSRHAAYVGLDTSFKLSRDYPDVVMPKLGVDGFRHVVQPYVSYSYVNVNEALDPRIGRIDRYVPTTRLRPIDMNQVTAIDEIRSWNVIRPGVYNRLLTKRDGSAYTWLELNSYFEAYPDDLEFDRDFSNFFNDIRWRPLPWLAFDLESQFPVLGGDMGFTEINTGLTFMPNDSMEFRIGDRLLQDHPFLLDSNLIDFSTYFKLSDRFAVGTQHRFEADDSTLESQQYMAFWDLNSWTMGLGAFLRDNRSDTEEFGVAFSLTLKDFPQFSLPIEFSPTGGSN